MQEFEVIAVKSNNNIDNHLNGLVLYKKRGNTQNFTKEQGDVFRTVSEYMDKETILFHERGMGQMELCSPMELCIVSELDIYEQEYFLCERPLHGLTLHKCVRIKKSNNDADKIFDGFLIDEDNVMLDPKKCQRIILCTNPKYSPSLFPVDVLENFAKSNGKEDKTTLKFNPYVLDIRTAIRSIAEKDTIISEGAKLALQDDNKMIEFTNEIVEQCAEEGTNQQRLEKMFDKDTIAVILNWNKRKAVEQDIFVMNKCLEADMEVEDNKPVKMHLLLTPDLNSKRPDTTKELMEWGQLVIMVDGDVTTTKRGWHCVLEDTVENFVNWFIDAKELIIGRGSPQLESFDIIDAEDLNREEIKELVTTRNIWK